MLVGPVVAIGRDELSRAGRRGRFREHDPRACRLFVRDHATKQMLRAKSRLAAKRFRSRAGAGFMDRAPAGHKGLAPESKADRGGGCKGGHLLA